MNPRDREYRNRIEIIRDILVVLSGDDKWASKTDIVYDARINFGRLDTYLTPLIENNLVVESGGESNSYSITKRGRSLLSKIEEVICLI